MRKEKKGHELEREIKTEMERNKAMRSRLAWTNTHSVWTDLSASPRTC